MELLETVVFLAAVTHRVKIKYGEEERCNVESTT